MDRTNNIAQNIQPYAHLGGREPNLRLPRNPIANAVRGLVENLRVALPMLCCSPGAFQLDDLPDELRYQIDDFLDLDSKKTLAITSCAEHGAFISRVTSIKLQADELATMLNRYSPDQLSSLERVTLITNNDPLGDIDGLGNTPLETRGRIKHLNLSGCLGITAGEIVELTSCFSNLDELNLSLLYRFGVDHADTNHMDYKGLNNAAVEAIAPNCLSLTQLNLMGCKAITNQALTVLAENCRNLTTLNLQYCDRLDNTVVTTLAQNFPKLTSLNLRGCSDITPEALAGLRADRPNLTLLS